MDWDEYGSLGNFFEYDVKSEHEHKGQDSYDSHHFLDSLSKELVNSSFPVRFKANKAGQSLDTDNVKSKENPIKRDRTLLRSGHRSYISSKLPTFKCVMKYGRKTGKCKKVCYLKVFSVVLYKMTNLTFLFVVFKLLIIYLVI